MGSHPTIPDPTFTPKKSLAQVAGYFRVSCTIKVRWAFSGALCGKTKERLGKILL
jgi:hypothetical protein